MKAIVSVSPLLAELKRMSQVISKNTVLPILSCVKLDFGKQKLTISASDLETTITSSVECASKTPFVIIVDFAVITEICSKLADQPITIEEKEKQIFITADNDKFKLSKEGDPESFPKIQEEEFLFSVDVDEDFFSSLFRADSCKNKNDMMVTTNTACLDFKNSTLSVVGTDAFALYKKDLKIKTKKESQSLVRSNFVHAVKSFDHGKLFIGEKFVKIEHNDVVVITRLQDNKYCNYGSVLTKEIEYNLRTNRKSLIGAIGKSLVGASKVTRLCALNFKENGITLVSQDGDFGREGESSISAIHSVGIEAIGVNGNQLTHLLNLLDSEEVQISVMTPTRSIFIKQADDDSVLCLLQPIMLQ